jgi:hypothetical protein
VFHVQSHVLLGDALNEAGRKEQACSAYTAVIDRWGETKEKSVTLRHARKQSEALGCK